MYLSSGLSFCRMRRTSCTMDGFSLLYLLMILLMRSGDVETNPGPDRIVSEEEFIKLSKLIEPGYYREVGVHLKISIAELGQIKESSLNTSDALMTVFTRWRDKQPPDTEIRALLAEGLQKSDLGYLSGELLASSLVLKRTGAPVTMPGSQTQPLSPDLIKRCADDFKSKYRTTLCKIRADPLIPISIVQFNDMYVDLVLEEEYRQRKRPLEYKDLFDLKVNGEFPNRIMVQGEAGAGKTTFCANIAWDWINDSPVLPKFVWVLVVPLREAKQYTIGEIAKSYLSKDNPATACQITQYLRSNPKGVFIAFDGLDEFDGKVVQQRKAGSKSADQTKARSEPKMNKKKRPKSSSPRSATSQPRVNSAEASESSSERGDINIRDILRSDELAACPVLVTSRPWKVTEIRWDDSLSKQYTFMHVEGFSKENVEVYIHKYFQDDVATADQLIQLIKDNDIISENMAPYPIYIAMLCLLWRELDDEKRAKFKSFQTFSQIFDEIFVFLKMHYAQKEITDLGSPSFKYYLSQIEKLMEPVAKVAFIGLQEKTLIFKENDFEQCSDSMETACRVGVLSQEKKMSSLYDKSGLYLQSTVFFPHKLFQEYMAGVHLASLYESDHNEFNRLIKQVVLPRKQEFRYLLYFTVSRDKTIANHVMKCMVQRYTPNEEDFFVDLSIESQDLDTAALVRNGGNKLLLRIDRSMTAHTTAGYAFTGLYKDMIALDVIVREFGPTTSHDVAEIICSAPSLKHVTLFNASFHSDFYAVLAKEGNKSKVQTVLLHDVRCPTSASLHHLVEALCSMPNLTCLTLGGKEFKEEFYSTLNAKASTLQVQTVKLWGVTCPTSASSHHLVDALCSMPNLTDVMLLHGEEFQEEFFSALYAQVLALQLKGRTLTVLHGRFNEELDDGTKKLREEGCAPKTPSTSDKEDEEGLVLPIKGNEIPAKKKKISEEKKKRAHDSDNSESNPVVKIRKKEDEDYRRKKEQTKQEGDRRIADGSERKERGESRRRYDDDEAGSSYHSARYEDDETKVKRGEDEQMDRNYRWDREREDEPRIDKRERERGRRDLDGETESERRGDREERRNDRSGEREDKRDRRDREKEIVKRDRERQQDSRDRHGERERERDRRDGDREKERDKRDVCPYILHLSELFLKCNLH